MVRRKRSFGELLPTVATLATIGFALILGADAQTQQSRPRLTLQDGSPCYYFNHFFERDVRATIDVQGPGDPLLGQSPVDRYGAYDRVAVGPGTHTFTAQCGPLTTSGTLTLATPNDERQLSLVFANRTPVLTSLVAMVGTTVVAGAPRNSAVTLVANVTDPDGDTLNFTWAVNAGSIGTFSGNTAQWILPNSPGLAFAYVLVTDGKGAFREGSTVVSTDAGIVPAPAGAVSAANPSDNVNAPDHFLTFFSTRDRLVFPAKNTDSRQGACQYYVAIGAVQGCGPGGEMVGTQLTFDGWRAKWGLDSPTAGFGAVYANIRDLDLERDMHGVTTENGTAYYVCNYPHVRGGQPDTNLLNVQRGENLVACVAMEHSPTPGVSGGQPFTKFLVFRPGGQLLPSVNLDQRGEKFLPGVCVVCHGARHGFTRFDENGSMSPDLAAQFLPFDLENFAYAASSGPLSRAGQEAQFRNLNLTLLKTDPQPALVELLNIWYPNPATSAFTDAVPPGWAGQETLYKAVVQKYCRTCHIAMAKEPPPGGDLAFPRVSDFDQFGFELAHRACGTDGGEPRMRWSMPNSKVTFDQFWNDGAAVAALQQHLLDRIELQPGEICEKP